MDKISKENIIKVFFMFSIVFYIILCLIYNHIFIENNFSGVTRVYLPDSKLYYELANNKFNFKFIRFILDNYHNVLGISLLTKISMSLHVKYIYINIIMVVLSMKSLYRLCKLYKINYAIVSIFFLLNPLTIYLSQTPTKEIILIFLTINFILNEKLNPKKMTFTKLSLIIIGLLIRYQISIVFICIISFSKLKENKRTKIFRKFYFLICMLYPLIFSILFKGLIVVGDDFRTKTVTLGVGKIFSDLLFKVPFAGYLMIPIRTIQNLLEPFPNTKHVVYYQDNLNIYTLIIFVSMLIMFYFTINYILLSINYKVEKDYLLKYFLFFSFIIASTNTFTHVRYLYNTFPIIIIYVLSMKKYIWNKKLYLKSSLIICFFILNLILFIS